MTDRQSRPFSHKRRLVRLMVWARRVHFVRVLTLVLAALAVVSVGLTFAVMTGLGPTVSDPGIMLVILNVNLAIMLALGVLVARRVVKVWIARRSGGAGSRLHIRLVVLFGVVAIIPAILTAVFSVLVFQVGVQGWFSSRVATALDESRQVAKAYLVEHQQAIAGDVLAIANNLNRNWLRISQDQARLDQVLNAQSAMRNLTEAVIFDQNGDVLARAGYTFSLQFEQVPFWALERADSGSVALLTGENEDRVRGLVRLDTVRRLYLYVGRFVDPQVLAAIERTEKAVDEYRELEGRRSEYELTLTMIFIMVSVLLLLAAIAVGLTIATRLARPVMALIDAADHVRQGNLRVRVKEVAASDEVASLSRAFNRMTAQIETQQRSLMSANRELDERRRFTETVLSGVTAGVIALDPDGLVTLANRSADELLGESLEAWTGRPLDPLLPSIGDLLARSRARPDRPVQLEVGYNHGRRSLTLLVRLSAECDADDAILGFVLTFDDITELQNAQRKAAWADVARRIAHEIKNPLTPIQLSAERLKRRYLKQLTDDQETFVQCTDTIVRHVADIGHMVDEFSAFARMPAPRIRLERLDKVVSEAVILQRTAFPWISFETVLPDHPVRVRCDTRQISQALTNLLKNAVEGIDGRVEKEKDQASAKPGAVTVRVEETATLVVIKVADNGKGLPDGDLSRLTEPYVTTRSKGTGLGLAIVKKIMEDHGGAVRLDNGDAGGAVVSLVLPRPDVDGAGPGEAGSAEPMSAPEGMEPFGPDDPGDTASLDAGGTTR